MELIKIRGYKDGGSIEITTDEGVFCIDNRLGSNLKGYVFNGYPLKDNSNYAPGLHKILVELLQSYPGDNVGDNISYIEQSLKLLKEPGIRLRESILKGMEKKKLMSRAIQSYCKRYGHEIGIEKAFDYLKRIHDIKIS